MNTTQTHSFAFASFSDLEVALFRPQSSRAANASAYIAEFGSIKTTSAANVRPFVPDPPSRLNAGRLVESVLLRAA